MSTTDSFSFVSYVLFDDYWLMKYCTPSPRIHRKQRRLLQRSVLLTASSDNCSQFCILPRGWSSASDATCTSHRHCMTLCTGRRYHSASSSKLRWRCSTVLAANVRSTSVMCAFLYTPLLLVRDYDQQTTVTSSFHACGRLGVAAAVSVCGPTI